MPLVDENLVSRLVAAGVVSDTFRRLYADKKERIYSCALRLFGEFGYDGLSVDQFCTEAGISKGSFFQYFLAKGDLLEFTVLAFDHHLSNWMNAIREADTAATARGRLSYLYDAMTQGTPLRPDEEKFFLFVTRASEHSAVVIEGVDLRRHIVDYVREIVARGGETGEIRGDVDVELIGRVTSEVMVALVSEEFGGRRGVQGVSAPEIISMLFDGIRA